MFTILHGAIDGFVAELYNDVKKISRLHGKREDLRLCHLLGDFDENKGINETGGN